jgi:hypothetical protein
MMEKSLYERLGGVFAIAAVVDHFSDAVVKNRIAGEGSDNPVLREWHTQKLARLPGLKFMPRSSKPRPRGGGMPSARGLHLRSVAQDRPSGRMSHGFRTRDGPGRQLAGRAALSAAIAAVSCLPVSVLSLAAKESTLVLRLSTAVRAAVVSPV